VLSQLSLAVSQHREINERLDKVMSGNNKMIELLDEKLELERWKLTAQYLAAPETGSIGLGDVRKLVLEQQMDQVVDVFGLKTRPSVEAVFNRGMLPAAAARRVAA
jgi:hypothetical protein